MHAGLWRYHCFWPVFCSRINYQQLVGKRADLSTESFERCQRCNVPIQPRAQRRMFQWALQKFSANDERIVTNLLDSTSLTSLNSSIPVQLFVSDIFWYGRLFRNPWSQFILLQPFATQQTWCCAYHSWTWDTSAVWGRASPNIFQTPKDRGAQSSPVSAIASRLSSCVGKGLADWWVESHQVAGSGSY